MATPESNRQSRLIMALIIFAGLVSGYIYYTQFSVASDDGITLINDNPNDTLKKFQNITFNFQVFNSESMKLLKIFGELPVKFDQSGRTNPFTPF